MPKAYIRFMGAYWSGSKKSIDEILAKDSEGLPFSMYDYPDVKELSQRPRSMQLAHIPTVRSQSRTRD